MELYQLRTFAAVAEAGHLTRAAERLHISQPAVSAQVKALEDELGVALFERTPNGMVLTSPGKRLLGQAERVLTAAQELKREARTLTGEVTGRVRVGTVSDPEFIRLGEFLSHAVDLYPLLELDLHQEVTGAAFESVRAGELDASFYFGTLTHAAVAALPLQEVVYRVAAPAAWKERVENASWNELAALPWILTPPISSHHDLVNIFFQQHQVEPTSVVQADHESVMGNLIVAGVGLSLLREDLARARAAIGEVVVLEAARLTTTLQFIYLAERADDPEIAALLMALRTVWKSEDAAPAKKRVRGKRRDMIAKDG
jgi:DNA-binding transcriptional LysR family regulator